LKVKYKSYRPLNKAKSPQQSNFIELEQFEPTTPALLTLLARVTSGTAWKFKVWVQQAIQSLNSVPLLPIQKNQPISIIVFNNDITGLN